MLPCRTFYQAPLAFYMIGGKTQQIIVEPPRSKCIFMESEDIQRHAERRSLGRVNLPAHRFLGPIMD